MRAIYNKLADTYDFRSNNPTTLLVRKKENKLIEKFAEGRVLDFGCGTGYHLSLFFPKKSLQAIQKKGITDMIGLDISENMIAKAHKAGIKNLIQSTEALPLKDGKFDTIICLYSVFN